MNAAGKLLRTDASFALRGNKTNNIEGTSEQWKKTAEVSVDEQIIFFLNDVHLIEYSEARFDEDVDESAT